jgi:stress response protein YsnF
MFLSPMTDDSKISQDSPEIRVPVSEEILSVGTRLVETGRGVRVHKTVTSEPVLVEETLTHKDIEVQRVSVGRTLEAGESPPTTRYEGQTLIVPIFEEVLVVERRMRLKEELHIIRVNRKESHVETVMLKTEKVSIERFDDSGTS